VSALRESEIALAKARHVSVLMLTAAMEHEEVFKAASGGLGIDDLAKTLVRKMADAAVAPLVRANIVCQCAKHEDEDIARLCRDEREMNLKIAREQYEKRALAADARIVAAMKKQTDNRPHLDADRALTPEVASTPWREREKRPVEQPPAPPGGVDHGISKAALAELGFDQVDDGEYVHARDSHVLKMVDDGFLIRDGWAGETTLKGQDLADLREALAMLN